MRLWCKASTNGQFFEGIAGTLAFPAGHSIWMSAHSQMHGTLSLICHDLLQLATQHSGWDKLHWYADTKLNS